MKTTQFYKSTKALALCLSAKAAPQESQRSENLPQRKKNQTGKPVQFKIAATPTSQVSIVGSFNRWDPTAHPLTYHPEDGLFKATLCLQPGTYKYRFLVDGVWEMDDTCTCWSMSSSGDLSCIMRV